MQVERQKEAENRKQLQRESQERALSRQAVQKELTQHYEQTIRQKQEEKQRARINSWQDMDEFRFKDEHIIKEQCDCCGNSMRYDHVFHVTK